VTLTQGIIERPKR